MIDPHLPLSKAEIRIQRAISQLSASSLEDRAEAIRKGKIDEACPRCPKVLVAGQGVYQCGCAECPFKLSESERLKRYPRTPHFDYLKNALIR